LGKAFALGLALWGLAGHPASAEDAPVEPAAPEFEEPIFSLGTPVGPFEYRLGRGLRFGDTGLVIGGFSTLEFDQEERENGEFEIDAVNLLVLYEPIPRLAIFSEIEIGDILTVDVGTGKGESDVIVEVERLYAEWRFADSLKARVGKFQTPVGRWNLVPSEPFVWTAIEPVGVEVAFDEYLTGGALHGTLYRDSKQIDYWLYGQATPQFMPENDPDPARATAGGRLAWGELAGWSLGSSFQAVERKDRWGFLGGLDAQWQTERFELTTEFLIQRGDLADREMTGVYVQGVLELCRDFYAVTRYEHFNAPGGGRDANLVDVGFAWTPLHFLHVKASYRFADEQTEEVRQGVSASVSFVF